MTTANLVINYAKKQTNKMFWVWHDGYQVDRFIEEGIKTTKLDKFTEVGLIRILAKEEFEDANSNDGRGDWSWVLTVLDSKHAVLTGAGCGEAKTKWINLTEKAGA